MTVTINVHHAKPRLVRESPEISNALTVDFGAITLTLFFEDDDIEEWWCLRNALKRSSSSSYWEGERLVRNVAEADALARGHYTRVKNRLAAQLDAAE